MLFTMAVPNSHLALFTRFFVILSSFVITSSENAWPSARPDERMENTEFLSQLLAPQYIFK